MKLENQIHICTSLTAIVQELRKIADQLDKTELEVATGITSGRDIQRTPNDGL